MRKLIFLVPLLFSVCIQEPVFAEDANDEVPLTSAEIVKVMAALPPEGCLFNPHAKYCAAPGGFDRGPDAKRIAEAIVVAANGRVTGSKRLDASLMATYSSYESGNKADAVGDSGKSLGAWQIKFIGETMFDPRQAAIVWRARAIDAEEVCKNLPPDERLASLAGGCMYPKVRQKVRQRMQAARVALDAATK
jgi:hypothetical protein